MSINHQLIQHLPSIAEMASAAHIQAKKSLGQHFLLDEHIADTMVRSVPEIKGGVVLEVGPGLGALTRILVASAAAHIIAVELDERFISMLQPLVQLAGSRLTLIQADAMEIDEEALLQAANTASHHFEKLHILANLPYNIGTALVCKWLTKPQLFASITVMLQKEVADRLIAKPGESSYGRLSVLTQLLCESYEVCVVPKESFLPPPKVTSSIVRLNPRPAPLYQVNIKNLERLTNLAFSHRRKMLRSTLSGLFPDVHAVLEECGINPTARPEELSVQDFCLLAERMP